MTFNPDVNKGEESAASDSRLGPSQKNASPPNSPNDLTSINNREVFGVVYRGDDGWRSRMWHKMVNRQSESSGYSSPVYDEKKIRPGTEDTLVLVSQLSDLDISVSSGSSGSGGDEASSYWVGGVPSDAVIFSHMARNSWLVDSLLVKVGTTPANSFDFKIDIGSTQRIKTLGSNTAQATFDISATIIEGEELRVTAPSTADPDIADVRCSFRLEDN